MLSTLREASKRGVPIITINPLRERGLERFTSPQHPTEMLTNSSTPISSSYYLVRVGGDGQYIGGQENHCSLGLNEVLTIQYSGNAMIRAQRVRNA